VPDQAAVLRGLARDDLFTVVHEQVMTDTCRWADVVLPATAFLEHREVRRGYGVMRLFDSPAVATPPGEAWSNHQLFAALSARLGLDRPGDPRTEDEVVEAIFADDRDGAARAARGRRRRDADPCRAAACSSTCSRPPPTARSTCARPRSTPPAPAGLYHYQPDPATAAFRWR
jgi:anaerobic selenocysteine-containing dehydrogenase